MSSAKNIAVVVVVEVDDAPPVEEPALLTNGVSCALFSSDQSTVPLLLPSTPAKAAMAWPALDPYAAPNSAWSSRPF